MRRPTPATDEIGLEAHAVAIEKRIGLICERARVKGGAQVLSRRIARKVVDLHTMTEIRNAVFDGIREPCERSGVDVDAPKLAAELAQIIVDIRAANRD